MRATNFRLSGFLALLVFSPVLAIAQELSAKALFFNPDGTTSIASTGSTAGAAAGSRVGAKRTEPLPQSVRMGARYFVRLDTGGGNYKDVSANRVFSTGDRFRLGLELNKTTYVYVLNKGSSGRVSLLYPSNLETPVRLKAREVVLLPERGQFRFKQPPGEEELLVMLSETPLSLQSLNLQDGRSPQADVVARPDKYKSEHRLQVASNSVPGAITSKDIAFYDDQEVTSTPSSYVVRRETSRDTTMSIRIMLYHE